jgi:hypothetical protein
MDILLAAAGQVCLDPSTRPSGPRRPRYRAGQEPFTKEEARSARGTRGTRDENSERPRTPQDDEACPAFDISMGPSPRPHNACPKIHCLNVLQAAWTTTCAPTSVYSSPHAHAPERPVSLSPRPVLHLRPRSPLFDPCYRPQAVQILTALLAGRHDDWWSSASIMYDHRQSIHISRALAVDRMDRLGVSFEVTGHGCSFNHVTGLRFTKDQCVQSNYHDSDVGIFMYRPSVPSTP